MFKTCLKALGVAAVLSLSVGTAQAITLGAGEAVCEGPPSLVIGICDGLPAFGDGNENGPGAGDVVEIDFRDGEGWVFGGVRGQSRTLFADNFNLVGDGLYRLTLTLLDIFEGDTFDATWTQGGANIGILGNVGGGVNTLVTTVNLSGPSLFTLDAAGGHARNGSFAQYKLTITAVPLPAGAVLLLSGLGGLALARRRTRA